MSKMSISVDDKDLMKWQKLVFIKWYKLVQGRLFVRENRPEKRFVRHLSTEPKHTSDVSVAVALLSPRPEVPERTTKQWLPSAKVDLQIEWVRRNAEQIHLDNSRNQAKVACEWSNEHLTDIGFTGGPEEWGNITEEILTQADMKTRAVG
jgi:hypothetical protein